MKSPPSLLFVLFAVFLLGSPAARSDDNNSISQISSKTADKNASLVQAEVSFYNGNMIITVKTEETPDPTSVRFFLDTDADGSTGYRPAWHKGGAEGANFMVEGGALFKWAGGKSQQDWNWAPDSDVGPVGADSPGEYQVSVSVPLAALGLKEGDTFNIFAVTGGADGKKPLDSIPRNTSWSVTVPPAGGAGSTRLFPEIIPGSVRRQPAG